MPISRPVFTCALIAAAAFAAFAQNKPDKRGRTDKVAAARQVCGSIAFHKHERLSNYCVAKFARCLWKE
jgi:hypothetical protein